MSYFDGRRSFHFRVVLLYQLRVGFTYAAISQYTLTIRHHTNAFYLKLLYIRR